MDFNKIYNENLKLKLENIASNVRNEHVKGVFKTILGILIPAVTLGATGNMNDETMRLIIVVGIGLVGCLLFVFSGEKHFRKVRRAHDEVMHDVRKQLAEEIGYGYESMVGPVRIFDKNQMLAEENLIKYLYVFRGHVNFVSEIRKLNTIFSEDKKEQISVMCLIKDGKHSYNKYAMTGSFDIKGIEDKVFIIHNEREKRFIRISKEEEKNLVKLKSSYDEHYCYTTNEELGNKILTESVLDKIKYVRSNFVSCRPEISIVNDKISISFPMIEEEMKFLINGEIKRNNIRKYCELVECMLELKNEIKDNLNKE